jgi:hypothetical protein
VIEWVYALPFSAAVRSERIDSDLTTVVEKNDSINKNGFLLLSKLLRSDFHRKIRRKACFESVRLW